MILPRGLKLNRITGLLVIQLLITLAGALWVAKTLPLGPDHVIRSAIWIEDRFVLVSEQSSRGSGRWGQTYSKRLFLFDRQDHQWIDLQSKLGIKEFDRQMPFRSADDCFCFFDRQSRLFKLNPRDKELPIQVWNLDSVFGNVVGNRFYLLPQYCLDIVSGSGFSLPDFGSGSVEPVVGADSFVVTYRSSGADLYSESGSGLDLSLDSSGEDQVSLGTEDQLHESLPEARLQHLAVITQDFSVEFIDRPEFLHYEWYDFQIQQQAMVAGRVPSDLVVQVLYTIGEGQLTQLGMWTAVETFARLSSRGIIATCEPSGEKIELRQGNSGKMLRQLAFPFAPKKAFYLSDGVLLFEGFTYRTEMAVDARRGDIIELPKDTHELIRSDDYAVCWRASVQWLGVHQLPSGELIQDLSKLDVSSPSIDFTRDRKSVKMLMSDGDIHLLNLETGLVQMIQPLLLRELICWIVGGLVVVSYVVWLFWCHQRQISIQIQGTVCASIAALVSWSRLDLAPTEIVNERPAFLVLAAALLWLGYVAIGKMISSRLPWFLKVLLAQLGYYAWYFLYFKPKSNEEEAITAIAGMFGFIIYVAVVHLRKRKEETSSTRFSLASILIVTAVCAVAIHQLRIVPWEPIFQVGLLKSINRSSVLFYSVVCLTVFVATWLSKNAYRLPKASVVLATTGFVAALFVRDTMSWFALEYDITWNGTDSYQTLLWLIRWLIFSGSVFCLGWNFSCLRARSELMVATDAV